MSNLTPSSEEMQKLVTDCQDAATCLLKAYDAGDTPRIIAEGRYMATAIPTLVAHFRTLEKEHRAMRECMEWAAEESCHIEPETGEKEDTEVSRKLADCLSSLTTK